MVDFGYMENNEDVAPSRESVATSHASHHTVVDSHTYTVTPKEAMQIFKDAQLPISLRTVQRYCEHGKLKCIQVDPETGQPTDKKSFDYLINPKSFDDQFRRMREKRDRQISNTSIFLQGDDNVASSHDESRQDAPSRDVPEEGRSNTTTTGHDTGEVIQLRDRVSQLEKQIIDAEVEKRAAHLARDYIKEVAEKELNETREKLSDIQYKLGAAETQLKALLPPNRTGEGGVEHQQAA